MTALGATSKARATMHLKVVRADGRVEEYDVPVETDLTKEQVLALIAQHNAAARRCGKPASAAVQVGGAGAILMCPDHLQSAREAAAAAGVVLTATAAAGDCTVEGATS